MQLSEQIWCFSSDKSSEGAISWWLDCNEEPVLIDCPEITTEFIEQLKIAKDLINVQPDVYLEPNKALYKAIFILLQIKD